MSTDINRYLPEDLRDTDVVGVAVVAPFEIRVTHRDGTSAVHVFEPGKFRGVFAPLRDPEVFATAGIVDGDTLGWIVNGQVIDPAPDALWLHAHGYCDGLCGRRSSVRP